MNRGFRVICLFLLIAVTGVCFEGCAKPLVDGTLMTMDPITRDMAQDPNTLYYAVRWALEECGYPTGSENLAAGVVESKWVPVGAGSHYVSLFHRRDYGANAAYYKMVVKIVPLSNGQNRVEAQTKVKSIVNNVRSTGDKERELLNRIAWHARGNNITVTNLGVEDN